MAQDRLLFFDTTLRDGEQSPGCSMTQHEKLLMAHSLEDLGVDILEAGFAISSDGDFAAIQAVSKEIRKPRITSLARARTEDIERAAAALAPIRQSCGGPRPRHREQIQRVAPPDRTRRSEEEHRGTRWEGRLLVGRSPRSLEVRLTITRSAAARKRRPQQRAVMQALSRGHSNI